MRQDLVATHDAALAERLAEAVADRAVEAVAPDRVRRTARAKSDSRFAMRQEFLEPPRSDPNGFERIIGVSDLMSINFLDRGRRAAAAVCRIRVPSAGGEWYGTGFLVGPRLLLTNHHVLGTRDEAAQAEAEFGYEHDVDGVLQTPVRFNLSPHELFYTDAVLDFSFVAVAPLSEGGVPLARYGRLPLIPVPGKIVDGEWVTIVQHPGGEPKQIAIRSSQITVLKQSQVPGVDLASFLHYVTDTEPGSSGSPVFNDQWQVVALHHKAVPASGPDRPITDDTVWIANEGVRISAIYRHLERNRFLDANAGLALDRLGQPLGLPALSGAAQSAPEQALEADRQPLDITHWAGVGGYDDRFLSLSVPLRDIYAPYVAKNLVAPLLDGSGHELAYRHYTSVIRADRKFPLLTAVNIDGNKLIKPVRNDTWRRDARIASEFQPAGNFYEKARGHDPVQFSRGHLVRLLDPCWGDSREEADAAMEDTFHYTNAAPQVQAYNDVDWGNLEDYLLDRAQTTEKKLTVFTGPIFRKDDPLYGRGREGGPWQIPLSFWKIAVLQKAPGIVSAAAFIVGQTEYVQALYEARIYTNLSPYTVEEMKRRRIQTTIKAVQRETGLRFAKLIPFDAHGVLESTRQTRFLDDISDVLI